MDTIVSFLESNSFGSQQHSGIVEGGVHLLVSFDRFRFRFYQFSQNGNEPIRNENRNSCKNVMCV